VTAVHQTTRCPQCQTAYRVTQEQLGAADGMVRCGKCLTTFNGFDYLVSPVQAPAPAPQQPAAEGPAEPPQGAAMTATRDDDDDFLIDDNFDISHLAESEQPEAFTAEWDAAEDPAQEPEREPDLAAPEPEINPGVWAEPEEQVAQEIPASSQIDVEAEPFFAIDTETPPQTEKEDEAEAEAAPMAFSASAGELPVKGEDNAAAIRVNKADDDQIVFTAGSPISPLSEELDSLELDKRAMSRWRPAVHNIIPEAGLIGRQPKRQTLQTWLWFLGSVLAAVTLSVQLIYFNSLLISRDSALWPLSSRVCAALDCPLPAIVDIDKILSTDLIIRSHPYTQGALLVDAVIVNTADFNQPFPGLTLAFEDLQGVVVARRTFQPMEYLMGELQGLTEMPSKQPVKLELEIVDPGKDAVSFRLFIAK
jgi:predicted Zn finger-like uncharacterized protein